MTESLIGPSGGNAATLNQLVVRLSIGPESLPTTYFMSGFALFCSSTTSGSVPRRPTIVMRASCLDLVVENARAADGIEDALRRIGDRRKDIVRSYQGNAAEDNWTISVVT